MSVTRRESRGSSWRRPRFAVKFIKRNAVSALEETLPPGAGVRPWCCAPEDRTCPSHVATLSIHRAQDCRFPSGFYRHPDPRAPGGEEQPAAYRANFAIYKNPHRRLTTPTRALRDARTLPGTGAGPARASLSRDVVLARPSPPKLSPPPPHPRVFRGSAS